MPKISQFFGVSIYMYFDDHPPPHFHARYGEAEAVIRIDDGSVMRGELPPRVLGLVVEWSSRRRQELRLVWRQASRKQSLSRVTPLE
ncbi:MAG: DUF4160 domain-containing protein [Gemmatimonadota bacterium]